MGGGDVTDHKPMEPFVVMVRGDNKRMPCYSADQIREAVERVRQGYAATLIPPEMPTEMKLHDHAYFEGARRALTELLHELGLDREVRPVL
jgi:hypothetical protein